MFGIGLVLLEPWVDQRIRHPGANPWNFLAATSWLVALGALFAVPGTVGVLFSDDACLCRVAPIPLGVPLAIAGAATLVTWVRRVRLEPAQSRVLAVAGRLGVAAAGLLGSAILATEVANLPI